MAREHTSDDSWGFDEGAEIAPGRSVLKAIGGGTAYEVLLVWDDHLFSIMVAKVVRPNRLDDEGTLRGLRREAEALERLAHPGLIRGFDAVLDPPYPHVLIEHLEGPTLRRLIKRDGPLPMQQLLPLALHVASVLHYLGGEEMVHLDVKPDNVIMGVPPRLIDLSVAHSFERAARIERTIGTDAYMAPEQCDPGEFAGRIAAPADVWGLAATVYHAAHGRVPFPRERGSSESEDPRTRFPQLAAEPEPLDASLPERLRTLLLAGMQRDPADRPTAREFALALEPLVAALPKMVRLGRPGHRPA